MTRGPVVCEAREALDVQVLDKVFRRQEEDAGAWKHLKVAGVRSGKVIVGDEAVSSDKVTIKEGCAQST